MSPNRPSEEPERALGSAWTAEDIAWVRGRVEAAVRDRGLRTVGGEIGRSTTGLRKFIAGAQPHPTTLRKLEAWVLREGRGRGEDAEAEVLARAAWAFLLEGLPEEVRRELRAELEGRIREVREGMGLDAPKWLNPPGNDWGPAAD